MKILTKITAFLILTLLAPFIGNAQKAFEGQIIYEISYEGEGLNEQMKSMLPDEMTFMLKDNNSRSELKTGMGNQVTIFKGDTKTAISLMDFMGQKVAIKKTIDELNLDRKKYNDLKVILGKETKEIAGYQCKKATIEVNSVDFNGLSTFTVYYTEQLGNIGINYSDPLFNQINGVMLEYEIKARGLLMKFSATKVNPQKIPEDAFTIPGDYKEMTQDELKKLFGGG